MKYYCLIPLVLLVAGCTASSLDSVFNSLPQVQSFLDAHPNANIVISYWTESEINASIAEISADCEKNMSIQAMYFARVSEGSKEVFSWFDETYRPLCIVSKGSAAEELTNQTTSETEDEDEAEIEEEIEEYEGEDQEITNLSLQYEALSTGCIKLVWTVYPESDLRYYKVVRSNTAGNPIYPDNGYISVITSRLTNTYIDCSAPNGVNYYGITYVTTEHNNLYSNPVRTYMNNTSVEEEELDLVLTYEAVNSSCIRLNWTAYPSGLVYYKVVRSNTVSNPRYPADGSIAAISPLITPTYLDCDAPNGINYYGITYVTSDRDYDYSNAIRTYMNYTIR